MGFLASSEAGAGYAIATTLAGVAGAHSIELMIGKPNPLKTDMEKLAELIAQLTLNGMYISYIGSSRLAADDPTGGMFFQLTLFSSQPGLKTRIDWLSHEILHQIRYYLHKGKKLPKQMFQQFRDGNDET